MEQNKRTFSSRACKGGTPVNTQKVAKSLLEKLSKAFGEPSGDDIAGPLDMDCIYVKIGMKYQALYEDTCGLLEGLASGRIHTSQPRIASNLSELCIGVELLGSEYIDYCYDFGRILRIASGAGLTTCKHGVALVNQELQVPR